MARLRGRQTTRHGALCMAPVACRIYTHTHIAASLFALRHNCHIYRSHPYTVIRHQPGRLCLYINIYKYMIDRTRAGHAESLYIKMREPDASFSSRAKKTNKGSPPPSSRKEVCMSHPDCPTSEFQCTIQPHTSRICSCAVYISRSVGRSLMLRTIPCVVDRLYEPRC